MFLMSDLWYVEVWPIAFLYKLLNLHFQSKNCCFSLDIAISL